MRQDARLVILDEPFRGLDRQQRQSLLQRARALWCNATLLCITHDIRETAHFDRVLVIAQGQVVEDGSPAALLADPQSHYHALHQAEAQLHAQAWADARWQKVRLVDGRVVFGESQS